MTKATPRGLPASATSPFEVKSPVVEAIEYMFTVPLAEFNAYTYRPVGSPRMSMGWLPPVEMEAGVLLLRIPVPAPMRYIRTVCEPAFQQLTYAYRPAESTTTFAGQVSVIIAGVPSAVRSPVVLSVQVVPDPFPGASDFIMEARVADPQFASDITAVCAHFFTAGGDFLVSVPMQPTVGDPTLWTLSLSVSEPIGPASWVAAVQATDMGGLTGAHAVFFSTL